MGGENNVPITDTVMDRNYLRMSIPEYQKFAEAVSTHCHLNRDGNSCKLKKAKTKKLKNLRYGIRQSSFLMKSMIWRAQLQFIENELQTRQKVKHYAKP